MRLLPLVLLVLLCAGCATSPPSQPNDLCAIFREKDDWYDAARNASERWNSPIPVMMSIMYHESGFRATVKPPRTRILWVIPGPRPSDAFGYAQALDSTWDTYQNATGSWGADRDSFEDAIDFIGWYNNTSERMCRIAPTNARHLYLAYHEGHRGYNRQTYRKKSSLQATAGRVARQAERYAAQLRQCEAEFQEKNDWWPFW